MQVRKRSIVMPRRVVWVIAALCLCAAVVGFSLGRNVAGMTETEAITAYAALYARETGGAMTDCAAVPGTGAVWLIVRCGVGEGARTYRVGRDGQLVVTATSPKA